MNVSSRSLKISYILKHALQLNENYQPNLTEWRSVEKRNTSIIVNNCSNNNTPVPVFVVLLSRNNRCESSPVHFMNAISRARWPPTTRPSQPTRALSAAIVHIHHRHLLWPPYVIGGPLYFCPVVSIFYLLSFFPRLISAAGDGISTILPHMVWPYCKFTMNVWNVRHAARCKYRMQKNRHFGITAQLCRAISSQLRHVSTIGKKLVKQQYLL